MRRPRFNPCSVRLVRHRFRIRHVGQITSEQRIRGIPNDPFALRLSYCILLGVSEAATLLRMM